MIGHLFDILLAVGLLLLAWRVVANPDLFRAIVYFIGLGLLMALCWVRLEAPDVALAEAAIGAGVTGALLLETYRRLLAKGHRPRREEPRNSGAVLYCLGLVVVLGAVLIDLPQALPELVGLIRGQIDVSGVTNPVTAVLLNFRAYDTLLEVVVLVLALLGAWTTAATGDTPPRLNPSSLPLDALIRVLAPLIVLVGGYILWAGAHTLGGAFQAAAVLAAMGVLLCLSEQLQPLPAANLPWRGLLILGAAAFCAVGLGVMATGSAFLQYPPPWAGVLILIIEASLTVSIALILVLLFSGARALSRRSR